MERTVTVESISTHGQGDDCQFITDRLFTMQGCQRVAQRLRMKLPASL